MKEKNIVYLVIKNFFTRLNREEQCMVLFLIGMPVLFLLSVVLGK